MPVVMTFVAFVFNCSLNGLLADPDTDFWDFCFSELDKHGGPDHDEATLAFLENASAHLMGRTAYEGMSRHMPDATDHPWAPALNAGNKIVVSQSMTRADWAGTTIEPDLAAVVERLGTGAGHVIVWGGVRLWRSLMALDALDEFRISLYPYVARSGTQLFDDVPPGYALELVAAVPDERGVLELRYRRRR
jgi:dihydrofolate reductase